MISPNQVNRARVYEPSDVCLCLKAQLILGKYSGGTTQASYTWSGRGAESLHLKRHFVGETSGGLGLVFM